MYNKAVIKKTDHHKSDVENKKWGARTGGLRVSRCFNPEPDLDNANVGRYRSTALLVSFLCGYVFAGVSAFLLIRSVFYAGYLS